MIGAPGVDTEARLGTGVVDERSCLRVVCSAEEGVDTESDEEELEEDDMAGI